MQRHPVRHRLLRMLWTIVATTIILVAFVISIARLFLPLIDNYRPEMESWASRQFGRPVKIGKVEVAWSGLTPVIRLRQVAVLTPSRRPWIRLPEIQIHIDTAESLLTGAIRTGRINIVSPRIDIRRDADGGYSISGLRTGRGGLAGVGGARALAWLLARGKVGVLGGHVTLYDSRVSKRPVVLRRVDLLLETRNGIFMFNGAADVAGDPRQRVLFVMNLRGPMRKLYTRFYMQGRIRAGPWLNGSLFRHADMRSGNIGFRIWGQGHRKLARFTGEIAIDNLKWGILTWPRADKPPIMRMAAVDALSGRFNWERTPTGWRFDADQIRLTRAGLSWPETSLRLVTRHSLDRQRVIEGRFTYLHLADLGAMLLATPNLDEQVRTLLSRLDVAGEVRDLDFRYYTRKGRMQRLFAKAGFRDYGHRAWGGLPGVQGLDGYLVLDDRQGFVNLNARGATLDIPRVFGNRLVFKRIDGRLFWKRLADGWRVDARDIRLETPHAKASGRVSIVRKAGWQSPFIDLRMSFRDGDASHAGLYLPRRIMRKKVVDWLDRALVSGRVTRGTLVYFGHTKDFPFRDNQGRFDVSFHATDAVLDFARGWPRLTGMQADIRFHNNSFALKMRRGRISGMSLDSGQARIAHLGRGAVLEVAVKARGGAPEMFHFLAASPVGRRYRGFLGQLRSQGPVRLEFSMSMPFRQIKQTRTRGSVGFLGADMSLSAWDVGFRHVHGNLHFESDSRGIRYTGKQLRARFRQRPARIDIVTRDKDGTRQVFVDLTTRIGAAAMLGRHGVLLARYMQGESDWLLRLVLDGIGQQGPGRIRLIASSDLSGTVLHLPGRLAKTASGKRRLEVTTLLQDGRPRRVDVRYPGLAAVLSFRRRGKSLVLDRGEIGFGRARASLPKRPGLRINGHLARFSLAEWRQWLARGGKAVSGLSWRKLLGDISLQADLADIYGLQLHELRLDVSRKGGFWEARADSDELRGNIRIPEDIRGATPVTLTLDHLILQTRVGKRQARLPTVDVRLIPNLKITSRRFSFNGIRFGRLELVCHQTGKGLTVDTLRLVSPHLDIRIAGSWMHTKEGSQTRVNIRARSGNAGQALAQLGYRRVIDEGRLDLQAALQWRGAPYLIDMFSLSGSIDLELAKGQLLNVRPGGGRIFGLLSLYSLPRRLLLDFRDVFKKGFTFDRISGHFDVEEGDAYTNDLTMDGPSARIEVSGRIGLATRDYRQEVVVTPRLASSMPVIGGILAGGPQVGVGVWVLDKLLGGRINRLSQVRYSITGSWDKPVVKKIGGQQPRATPHDVNGTRPQAGPRR